MRKIIALAMIFGGAAGQLLAGPSVPEIDASSGVAALALIAGGLLVLRTRRPRR
jgi:hypothetical protein